MKDIEASTFAHLNLLRARLETEEVGERISVGSTQQHSRVDGLPLGVAGRKPDRFHHLAVGIDLLLGTDHKNLQGIQRGARGENLTWNEEVILCSTLNPGIEDRSKIEIRPVTHLAANSFRFIHKEQGRIVRHSKCVDLPNLARVPDRGF